MTRKIIVNFKFKLKLKIVPFQMCGVSKMVFLDDWEVAMITITIQMLERRYLSAGVIVKYLTLHVHRKRQRRLKEWVEVEYVQCQLVSKRFRAYYSVESAFLGTWLKIRMLLHILNYLNWKQRPAFWALGRLRQDITRGI